MANVRYSVRMILKPPSPVPMARPAVPSRADSADFVAELVGGGNLDDILPALARDAGKVQRIERFVQQLPTRHELLRGDACHLDHLDDSSVHLVVTSPPYWTLKRYNEHEHQLGHVTDYNEFLKALDAVWAHCLRALVPGGRLVCVVGDVCLSRRKNNGRHTVVPLHAAIQERCRRIGFDNLASIFWHKIANARYEVEGNTAGFLGKPYEPNAVIKNDVEFILMQRKPGGYRSPGRIERVLSVISADNYQRWFRQVWGDVTGASTRKHPAPYPLELAERLVRMFSFVGDTVLDPFMGIATTNLAAARWGRNSIGVEIDESYFEMASNRMAINTADLYMASDVAVHRR